MKLQKQVTLEELESGSVFYYDGCYAVKSDYRNSKGAIEAYIIGSGDAFWGGANNSKDQKDLLVYPVELKYVQQERIYYIKVLPELGYSYTPDELANAYVDYCNESNEDEDGNINSFHVDTCQMKIFYRYSNEKYGSGCIMYDSMIKSV
jgi:hypothetical protein